MAGPALAYAFAVVGSRVLDGGLRNVDAPLRDWIVAHRTPVLLQAADAISAIGATQQLLVVALLVGWLVLKRGWAWMVMLALAAFTSSWLVDVLKAAYGMPRPPTGVLERQSLSFPSGHSAGSAAIAVFLGYVAVRSGRASPRVALACGASVVLLVGLSRIYLDFHWFSDVIGGWITGAAVGVGCCALWEWIQHQRHGYQRRVADSETVPAGDASRRS